MINFSEIIIPKLYLWLVAVLFLILAITGVMLYLIRKKMKQKFLESPEYKKMSKEFDRKLKMKTVTVKAEKTNTNDIDNVKGFNLLKSKSKLSFAYWKNWYIERYFPAKCVMIHMELINGFHRLFIVVEKEGGFLFRGNKYIFDDDSKYYNMDLKMYVFDYHENITIPIKRKIPVSDIKKTIESTESIDIEYAINPSTLQRFMIAKIAEGVMKGTMLDEFLRKLQMVILVILATSVVHLALFLWASGLLENIQMPF